MRMSKIIQGKRVAHDFKNIRRYSPTCDCGICACFGNNTSIIYGYKQIIKCDNYYCSEHLESGKLNKKMCNEYFLKIENKDRLLKNKPCVTNVEEIISDRTINGEKKCYYYQCENIENLTNIHTYSITCVCKNCATNDDTYFSAELNQNNKEFTCPNCNVIYKIKYDIGEDGNYEYVACNNPYTIIGTCYNMYSDISRDFCTEINSKSKIVRPIAIKPKRKNKSKNIEDLTIPENIITDF